MTKLLKFITLNNYKDTCHSILVILYCQIPSIYLQFGRTHRTIRLGRLYAPRVVVPNAARRLPLLSLNFVDFLFYFIVHPHTRREFRP